MTTEIATFANGCFWCTEAVFDTLAGVSKVQSGYIGGQKTDPTYEQVCSGRTGHAEAVRVWYDPAVVRYGELLDVFFATHDPTTLNRQGNDTGTQYRSAIYPHGPGQRAEAEAAIARAQADQPRPIVTAIEDGEATWYPAEDYHQRYFERVGAGNGYCMATIPPKLAKLRAKFADRLKVARAA